MKNTFSLPILLAVAVVLVVMPAALAADKTSASDQQASPTISISEEMGDAMFEKAKSVKEQLEQQTKSLFERSPLGWNWETIDYLYQWLLQLPLRIPDLLRQVVKQSRLLGVVGSLVILLFLGAIVYSLIGQNRVLRLIESHLTPFQDKIPTAVFPFVISASRVMIAALFPLLLLGIFALINAMIQYRATWFTFLGHLLVLWAVAALFIGFLRECLTRDLFAVTQEHGKTIFRLARLVILYMIGGIALVWGAEAFQIRSDVVALLQFVISISIVLVLFLLHLKKKALMSLLPELPYRSYQGFARLLERYYFPLIFFSLGIALLWCLGYRQLGRVVLLKIWTSGAAYLGLMVAYHLLGAQLSKWAGQTDPADEAAQSLFRSLKSVLLYTMAVSTVLIFLNLLGLLWILEQLMSFPLVQLGQTEVTLWIIIKAVLILLAFVYASRLLQAYLDYKIYPKVGIEPGLGYALNTFFKYFTFAIGFLISLKFVGLDLRFLYVFAGAIGIGIGLGLQGMAANMISGFVLIFGGNIRKGDWIEVSGTIGLVTDIYLRATKVRTRDNIEYLIPNSDFISGTVVNYSLSSPMIRIDLPVGVSYGADPSEVEKILLTVAEHEPLVSKQTPPTVRFVEYGDNSINFELLIWIDVRKTARRLVRSALYFKIFAELHKANIEIPFPQRDIHIRSTVARHDALTTPALEKNHPEEEASN
jgi:small-conductance mechanosensitive channel